MDKEKTLKDIGEEVADAIRAAAKGGSYYNTLNSDTGREIIVNRVKAMTEQEMRVLIGHYLYTEVFNDALGLY